MYAQIYMTYAFQDTLAATICRPGLPESRFILEYGKYILGLQSIEVRLSIKVYPKINILDIRYGLYLVEAEINHLFFLETFLLINTHPKSVALTDRSGSSIALTSLKCIVILDNIVAVILF